MESEIFIEKLDFDFVRTEVIIGHHISPTLAVHVVEVSAVEIQSTDEKGWLHCPMMLNCVPQSS